MAEIRVSRPVAGSKWLMVGYVEPGLVAAAARKSWQQAAVVLALLLVAGGISFWKIGRLERDQRRAFRQLRESNATLAGMAAEQRALREAAEAGERTKAQFLESMSHEIRTPLNAVIGLTDLVLKTWLTPHQEQHLTRVSVAGRNLLGLINDILDFSKIEAGKLTIETVDFEIDQVLANLATVVSTKAEENGNEVIIIVDRRIPVRLTGDPLRIGQILINLVGNAAKFTENGEILVDIARQEADGREWLVATVRDNGIGMNAEQRERLFKPFTQADESVVWTHGGTGLGLSISSQLVEAMGGAIGVDCEPGKGSAFWFRIPLAVAKNSAERPSFEGVDPRSVRILLVDDSEIVRATLGCALQALKFNVDVAATGEDAVARFLDPEGETYDVVLMDWQLPGIDGLEATRRINAGSGSDRSPVIIMISSMDRDVISGDFSTAGGEYFLQKPINTSFLVDTLMAFFNERHSRRPIRQPRDVDGAPMARGDNRKLLLVEDNELNQMVALGVLQHAGFQVDVAENGKVAVGKLHAVGPSHYALVLMDIQMPEMDGLTATRCIREDLGYADLLVIAMTAHAFDEERERCLRAGMNDHVSKPIDARELIAKINKWSQQAERLAATGT
ncbi:MAG: response regulator [Rhodospirillaceae bacterium]